MSYVGFSTFDLSIPFSEILQFLENHQGILTVVGWVAVFLVAIQVSKIQLRNNARLEIYKELHELKTNVDDSSVKLGLLLSKYSLPFREMEWAERGIQLNDGKTATDIWFEQNRALIDANTAFFQSYQRFLQSTTKWISLTPSLRSSRNILAAELDGLSRDIWAYIQFHMSQPTNEHNWRMWDRNKIEDEVEKIQTQFNKVASGFLNDYMDLIHDELVRPIFNVKNIPREDFNYVTPVEAETLTREGIKVIQYKPMEGARLQHEKLEQVT